jgi:hypothetical protein
VHKTKKNSWNKVIPFCAQKKTFFMEEVMNALSSFLKDDIFFGLCHSVRQVMS